jgi:hypothetical protein
MERIVQYCPILTAQGHAFVEFGICLNEMVKQVSEPAKSFY